MKLFQVIYEEDGETTKEPDNTRTVINRNQLYYAARLIDEVGTAVDWIRTGGEERTLISIAEVAPAVQVIGSPDSAGDGNADR